MEHPGNEDKTLRNGLFGADQEGGATYSRTGSSGKGRPATGGGDDGQKKAKQGSNKREERGPATGGEEECQNKASTAARRGKSGVKPRSGASRERRHKTRNGSTMVDQKGGNTNPPTPGLDHPGKGGQRSLVKGTVRMRQSVPSTGGKRAVNPGTGQVRGQKTRCFRPEHPGLIKKEELPAPLTGSFGDKWQDALAWGTSGAVQQATQQEKGREE